MQTRPSFISGRRDHWRPPRLVDNSWIREETNWKIDRFDGRGSVWKRNDRVLEKINDSTGEVDYTSRIVNETREPRDKYLTAAVERVFN